MIRTLDAQLEALGRLRVEVGLEGLEDSVCSALERRRRQTPSPRAQAGMALTAVAIGLVMGLGMHAAVKPAPYASEMRMLSEDGLLVPSIRLGGA